MTTTQPLDRVVFAQHVFKFAPHSWKRLVQLSSVCSTFRDTVLNYATAIFECWRNNDDPFKKKFNEQFFGATVYEHSGSFRFLKQFLDAGASANAIGKYTFIEMPILCAVASAGRPADGIPLLLAAGADIQAKDKNSLSPLHFAARGSNSKGRPAAVKQLLEAGALVSAVDVLQSTPLHFACNNGNVEIVRALLASDKCDANKANFAGATPLYTAASEGHAEIVGILIDAGARSDAMTVANYTPLAIAAQNGRVSCVRALLQGGAKADCARIESSPLILGAKHGHASVVRELIKAGVNLDIGAGVGGGTALHAAAFHGHASVVGELLQGGASKTCVDGRGKTALHYALNKKHKLIAEFLQEQ